MTQTQARHAVLFRMVMEKHVCPFGLKSLDLLHRRGFSVEDHPLETREETDAFMRDNGVETTPQTFIDGRRVGGYDDLRRFFGQKVLASDATRYRPVVVVFAMVAVMAAASTWYASHGLPAMVLIEHFASIAMCVLAILKLQDLERFSTMFLGYDLLARRWVRYAYLYPFAEALSGLLMLAGVLPWISGPLALFIGGVGAVSVIYAVYVQRRQLKCACVGGGSQVPLGFVSLSENLLMTGMGMWMLFGVVHSMT